MSASGPEEGLLLDKRDVRSTKRHHLRLHTHQLPGSNDQYSKFILIISTFCHTDTQKPSWFQSNLDQTARELDPMHKCLYVSFFLLIFNI